VVLFILIGCCGLTLCFLFIYSAEEDAAKGRNEKIENFHTDTDSRQVVDPTNQYHEVHQIRDIHVEVSDPKPKQEDLPVVVVMDDSFVRSNDDYIV
jgi:hypothetical protein